MLRTHICPGLAHGSAPDCVAVRGVVILLPGHEAQHGAGERVPAGGRGVEDGQGRGGRCCRPGWAGYVELLAPGDN